MCSTWSTSQDAVATIKRHLQLLVPGGKIFLDVDDLDDISRLEKHVEASATMLVMLGAPGYFASKNCLRELAAAQTKDMPLVLVHDQDVGKGGSPLEVLKTACRSDTIPHEHDRAPSEFFDFLFVGREVIPWHRFTPLQLVTLKRIAEEMLLGLPAYRGEGRHTDGRTDRRTASYTSEVGGERNVTLIRPGESSALCFSTGLTLRTWPVNRGAMAAAQAIADGVAGLTVVSDEAELPTSIRIRSTARGLVAYIGTLIEGPFV